MRKIIIILALILFFIPNTLAAEILKIEVSPTQMNFLCAIKYSLENNNNIRAMRDSLSATERNIGIERSVMMPKLKFNENFTVTNNPAESLALRLNQARTTPDDFIIDTLNHPNSVTNFLTSGVLEQTILDRKAILAIRMAKKEYSANGYLYLRAQEELINKVSQDYSSVNTNRELIKVAELAVSDLKEQVKLADALNPNNSIFTSDQLRARAGLAEREEKLTSAKRSFNVSRRKLGLTLGLYDAVDVLDTLPFLPLFDIDYYKCLALYRNDVKAREIKLENAKNNIKLAQAGWYPTLNAFASYNLYNKSYPFGAQGNNYIAAAFFKWDVFDGNKRKYEILKAKDKEAEACEYLEAIKKEVSFKVYEVYSHIEAVKNNLELAIQAKAEAEKAKVIIIKRWQDGELPYVSVSDIQEDLENAREAVVKKQNELKLALIDLYFESGIIAQCLGLK